MGFRLVPKLVTLNDLERRNDRRRALSLLQLSFLFPIARYSRLSRDVAVKPSENRQFLCHTAHVIGKGAPTCSMTAFISGLLPNM